MENTYYYHTKQNNNGRRATFAGVVENGTIKIGLAVCSNKDQFQKRIGRNISGNRARIAPISTVPIMNDVRAGVMFRRAAEILSTTNKDALVKLITR
jgi:hypothetical protein